MRLLSFMVLAAGLTLSSNLVGAQAKVDDGVVDGKAVKDWIPLLEDKDRKVRYAAVAALAKAGEKASEAIPALEKMQKDMDPYNKTLANYALAYVRPVANAKKDPAELLKAMKDKSKTPDERSVAASYLAALGSKAAPVAYNELIGVLKTDPESYNRALAAYVLPYMKPKSGEAAPPLVAALNDKNKDVARTAAQSLVTLGSDASTAATSIVAVFSSPEPYRRALACYVIMHIKADKTTPGLIDGLKKLVQDPNEAVKQAAREAFKKIDPEGAKREGVF